MKMQFACLLLVLLSAAVLSLDPTFQQKHVIEAADNQRDCTTLMTSRNLFTAKNKKVCTYGNTFIVENSELSNICAGGVKEKKSEQAFQILDCTLDKKSKLPQCDYKSVTRSAPIILTCKDNQPVSFKGAIRN